MRHGVRFALVALIVGCMSGAALAAPKPDLTTPAISCVTSTASSITLQVCGTGTFGAPAGFSIHIKTLADYNIDGWNATGSYTCISLGGNCPNSPWSLSTGECVNVVISATTVADYAGAGVCGVSSDCGLYPLQCGTQYVFRVFAHGNSDYGASPKGPVPPLVCSTAACNPGGCTFTWGYWKTHGPEGCSPGNQENDWNVTHLVVGSLDLNEAALCAILHDNPNACAKGGGANAGANATLILEHQLIAAMLNQAEGLVTCAFADAAIVQANNLLSGREYDCVGASTALGQQMIAVKDVLAAYNDDQCSCPVLTNKPETAAPAGTTTTKPSTWGTVKKIYR